jgi:hypothetical protein
MVVLREKRERPGARAPRKLHAIGLLLAWLLAACGDPEAPGPKVGSNSNWLRACTASEQCDEAPVCECGACTERCSSDADCAGLGDARCARADDPAARSACGGADLSGAGMCLPRCTPGSCDDGQACVDGACVLAALPDVPYCAEVRAQDMTARAREERLLELVQSMREAGATSCGGAAAAAPAPAFRLDPRLICEARVFARDLDEHGFTGLADAQGRSPEDRLGLVGYRARLWGESFALQTSEAGAALAFMLEPVDSCQRLTDARYVDIGVGNANDTWLVTIGLE